MSKAQRLITTLLTVNAVLLAGLLWVQVAAHPIFAEVAYAQSPNAGLQRDRMMRQLADIQKAAQATQKVLETGYVRVVVVQAPPKKR